MVTSRKLSCSVGDLFCSSFQEIIYPLSCLLCKQNQKMTTIPQGMLMVEKIRKNEERGGSSFKNGSTGGNRKASFSEMYPAEPLHYNKKMMDSIWGLYNRYSVHNLKNSLDKKAVASSYLHH